MRLIILLVFMMLNGCLGVSVLTGAIGVGDSYLKEKKLEELDEKIKQLEKKQENREERQIDSMLQIK
jgi:hypothetical protein